MRIGVLVGALALALGTMASASAEPRMFAAFEALAPAVPRVTEANIAKLKSALNLTPHQLAHWMPVEAALRALAKEQRDVAPAALAGDVNASTAAMAAMLGKMRRLAAAAGPLIRSLDETQRRDAMTLVRRLGYERLVAAF